MGDEQTKDNQPAVGEEESKDPKDSVHFSVASLHELSALESETLAAEIHLLGQLRDRISPAARYADKIQTKYRRTHHKTEAESEQTDFLVEGFPFAERGKPLTGLLVIDKYANVDKDDAHGSGQYVGERLYLTHDRKWIVAERVGTYSETAGSTSEWETSCRIVTDRSLLEHYPIDTITNGLFEATNKLWERLTPRMDALKKRSERAQQVSSTLAQLKSLPQQRFGPAAKPKPEAAQEEVKQAATTMSQVHLISRS